MGFLLWGHSQTKSNKMISEAPASSEAPEVLVTSYFLINYFLINNKPNIAATGKLMN